MPFTATICQAAAWAGPPFTTNDPDPPEPGQYEINLLGTLERSSDRSHSGELLRLDINYGYDAFTQLSVELPIPYSQAEGQGIRAGVGDVLLEYKRRFGTASRRGYWGINPEISLPTGDQDHGLGAGRVTVELPLLYQRQWGDAVFYADLRFKGWAGEKGKSSWFLGGAFEHQVSARLQLGAEAFATTPEGSDGEYNGGFNVGFRYAFAPGVMLMGSAGHSFRSAPDLTVLVGLKMLLPP
ncbi:MAG: transporter [Pseudomonadota bacterium]